MLPRLSLPWTINVLPLLSFRDTGRVALPGLELALPSGCIVKRRFVTDRVNFASYPHHTSGYGTIAR